MGLEILSPPLNSLSRVVLIFFKFLKNYYTNHLSTCRELKIASQDGVFNNYDNFFWRRDELQSERWTQNKTSIKFPFGFHRGTIKRFSSKFKYKTFSLNYWENRLR